MAMTPRIHVVPILLMLLVSACAVGPGKEVANVPVEERTVPAASSPETPGTPVPAGPVIMKQVTTETAGTEYTGTDAEGVRETGPAVIALLDEAEVHTMAGRDEQASASLERALRIEPKNAQLWYRLALVRLRQGQWSQALALANKSIALSGRDHRLQADNWEVIARAYDALGKPEEAAGARKKSRGLAGKG